MRDRSILLELFLEIEEAIRRIERRFIGIDSPGDFLRDDAGLDRLDAIAMMLIAIGENVQRIDKRADRDFFKRQPSIDWEGVKGIRNLLAHNYFNIDAEEIYKICSQDIEPLKRAIQKIRSEIF
ncbi:DUF86 domain-containing protein [Leptolyngbya sp. O-77]|uniref:HepT-like ribonuclease domain-containing protein n=1 Tax=Leptolyngbya sp. O-77 TaxID=1080068 RepID=UPI00074D32C7|nr:DUF86 domain-containing protein [Leptolyngbya sp. O-77]BAU42810.1 hypothetical protein O77CONTIG1_02632 [Leptolyngbya sp. O-77]